MKMKIKLYLIRGMFTSYVIFAKRAKDARALAIKKHKERITPFGDDDLLEADIYVLPEKRGVSLTVEEDGQITW